MAGAGKYDNITLDLDSTYSSLEVKSKGITNAQIADNTITVANMGNGSVTSDAILNGTIIGDDLADDININTGGVITAAAITAI